MNSGQVCVALKRLYVHESLFERLKEALVECASQAKLGGGFEAGVEYGPINNLPQLQRAPQRVRGPRPVGSQPSPHLATLLAGLVGRGLKPLGLCCQVEALVEDARAQVGSPRATDPVSSVSPSCLASCALHTRSHPQQTTSSTTP